MFYSDYKNFLDNIFTGLGELGVDVSEMKLDHIAYQVSSSEEYEELKPKLLEASNLVKEALVSERRVGVFKFNEPLEYNNRIIETIELIEPVSNDHPESKLEHAEFLLNETFDSFLKKYPDIGIDESNRNRDEFPMLRLKLKNGLRVKFPKYPILEDV